MSLTSKYDDLFTSSRDADLWNDLYENPTKVYHYHMALRRDYATEFTLQHFDKSAKILDLGCGAGVFMEKLLERGYSPTGADASEDMLKLAAERLAKHDRSKYRLLVADCQDLPFEDEEFDVVLGLGVFGYIEDVDRALAEIRRVLRPGGMFFMSIRNRANFILSDPYRMATWSARTLGGAIGLRKLKRRFGSNGSSSNQSVNSGQFHIAIYDNPRKVIRGITKRGFDLEKFDGIGYGPLALFKKEILPVSTSAKLSNFLNRFFRKSGLSSSTAWLADVSIYIFRKS